jgi:hypothetical protein
MARSLSREASLLSFGASQRTSDGAVKRAKARAYPCDVAKLDCQSDERGFDVGALEGDDLLDGGGCSFRTSGGHASKSHTMS